MGKCIVVANQKGGVGKTTTVINISHYIAMRGYKVLAVDIDPQGNLGRGLGIELSSSRKGTYEALMNQEDPNDIVIPSKYDNLFILPANIQLAGAQVELMDYEDKDFRLKNFISEVKEFFDFIFIDTPPSLGILTINGLVAADSVLIPLQTEFFAMEGLVQLLKTIKTIQKSLNTSLTIEGLLLTMYDIRTKLSKDVAEQAKDYFKERVYNSFIPRNVRLSEAPSYGKSIFDYDPTCPGAIAYQKVAEEILAANKI
ncbi:MAG: AAA family ATPase [Spirochaetia bacterium]|nr:AAA family ATPase [Spirochaetota bacterium]MCX8096994.1 AAA family ATPase [Spirochaetota bacterium]MDW8111923.1 AAA family ATPase [Spirochaetia bacterium]